MSYIFIDESGQFSKNNGEKYFVIASFIVENPRKTGKQYKSIIQVEMIDSASNINIQIADWIVGALACYLENKRMGNNYYKILKNNLIDKGKELFK